jgi:hypothetical protein
VRLTGFNRNKQTNKQTRKQTMKTKQAKTGIIYRGPSLIDGAPIVVVAVYSNRNRKTGAFLQTYILRDDMNPLEASKTGADSAICGDCPLRGETTTDPARKQAKNRRCYVNLGQGPLIVFKGLQRDLYPDAMGHDAAQTLGRGRMVRLGTYGDPCAVPSYIWESLVSESIGWTGYTHSGAVSGKAHDMHLTMQSADSLQHAESFWKQGARTFRVIQDISEMVTGREILCPASKEAGARVQCEACKLCQGTAKKGKSIAIVEH